MAPYCPQRPNSPKEDALCILVLNLLLSLMDTFPSPSEEGWPPYSALDCLLTAYILVKIHYVRALSFGLLM